MIKLPPKERKIIAQTARDVARFADERAPHLSGRRRFAVARAEGRRRLKGSGMPQDLARSMAPHIQPEPAEQDDDEQHLSPDERALRNAGKRAAGATVGVIADGIETAAGCECPKQLLALVRALLESGIEAAVQAVR